MKIKIFPWVAAASLTAWTAGCYQSTGGGNEDATVDNVPDVHHDPNADPDGVTDPIPDPIPDVNHEPATELIDVIVPDCLPQQAWEDPNIDCMMCDPCWATPYIWRGDRCDFAPLCCACAGPDCAGLFVTLRGCLDAYRSCPASTVPVRYPEARLAWMAPGGEAGMGPMLLMDGGGRVRFWEFDAGIYDLNGPGWDRTDWTYSEEYGVQASNEFSDMLMGIDYANLPHPPTHEAECYPRLMAQVCQSCEQVYLDYWSAQDLLPEFYQVYDWLDQRLCRGISPSSLPGSFCDFDF